MEQLLTEELLCELLDQNEPTKYLDRADLGVSTLSEYLNDLLVSKDLKRAEVVRAAGLNETFGYQIFTGARNASRDKLLQLSFAMGLTLRETNRLLRRGGVSDLYCKSRRDAIIIFGIEHGFSLQEVDECLYRFGENTIC